MNFITAGNISVKEKVEKTTEPQGLQVWKVIGVFAMVFLVVQLVVAAFGVGINFLMSQIGADANIRVFIGSTISRVGMIASVILITTPVMRALLKKPVREILYPFNQNWQKDLFAGMGFSILALGLIFFIELAFGWLKIKELALLGQPVIDWLRSIWLSLLVNLTAALSEEVLFRGFLVTALKKAWDEKGAIFVSAVIFGASHLLVAGASQSNWLEFIPMLALPGAVLGLAYLRTGNLWLASGIHFAWNLFQDDILNLTGRRAGETLFGFSTSLSGPIWFTGSSFGIETGMVGIIGMALILFIVLKFSGIKKKAK